MNIIKINTFGELIVFIILFIAIFFAFTVFELWLWKVVIAAIFGLPQISFWQFVGLKFLLRGFMRNSEFCKIKFFGDGGNDSTKMESEREGNNSK